MKTQMLEIEGATLQYTLTDNIMNILSVFTMHEFRGKGLAKIITKKAFELAKTKGYKIIPTCPYVSNKFVPDHPEYKKLLK